MVYTLSAFPVTEPEFGTLSLNTSNGSFTYVPDEEYHGIDEFSYRVSDGTSTSDVATGRLVRVLPEYSQKGAALHVVYPSARQVPTKVSLFRDFLAKGCARANQE